MRIIDWSSDVCSSDLHHGLLVVNRKSWPPPVLGSKDGGQVSLRSEGSAREFSIVGALRKTGPMLARAQARHRPEVARQWTGRRGSELLRDAEPDDARVERENVGGQAGIIRIEEGIRDRCRVEYVFDIGFDRQFGRASCRERVCPYV